MIWFFKTLGSALRKLGVFILYILTESSQRLILLSTLLGTLVMLLAFGYFFFTGYYIPAGISIVSAVLLVHINKQL